MNRTDLIQRVKTHLDACGITAESPLSLEAAVDIAVTALTGWEASPNIPQHKIELRPCPICEKQAKISYCCGDFFVVCSTGCEAPMCDHASEVAAAVSWNDWAKWYALQVLKKKQKEGEK